MQDRTLTPFEVYSPRCRVTFPVETRRCVHCGGPTSREGVAAASEGAPALHEVLPEEEGFTLRRGPFSPVTLLWIALLLGGYLARSCS